MDASYRAEVTCDPDAVPAASTPAPASGGREGVRPNGATGNGQAGHPHHGSTLRPGIEPRPNLVLNEAGIEDPVAFEEDPGTSSRLHPLQRPKFSVI